MKRRTSSKYSTQKDSGGHHLDFGVFLLKRNLLREAPRLERWGTRADLISISAQLDDFKLYSSICAASFFQRRFYERQETLYKLSLSCVSCTQGRIVGWKFQSCKKAHLLQTPDVIRQNNSKRHKIGYSGLIPSESHDNLEKSKFCSSPLIRLGQKGKKEFFSSFPTVVPSTGSSFSLHVYNSIVTRSWLFKDDSRTQKNIIEPVLSSSLSILKNDQNYYSNEEENDCVSFWAVLESISANIFEDFQLKTPNLNSNEILNRVCSTFIRNWSICVPSCDLSAVLKSKEEFKSLIDPPYYHTLNTIEFFRKDAFSSWLSEICSIEK
eukprot:IDg23540t1